MWNLDKNGTDKPIGEAERETQMRRANKWTPRGKGGWNELRGWG